MGNLQKTHFWTIHIVFFLFLQNLDTYRLAIIWPHVTHELCGPLPCKMFLGGKFV